MDANSYHESWRSDLKKNLKWVGRTRGIELIYLLDEIDMHVCNKVPHTPTFIGDSKNDYSHIDVTLCTGCIFNQIEEWKVLNETFGSDHASIKFKYMINVSKISLNKNIETGIPWKNPSKTMKNIMEKVLSEAIKTIGKITLIDTVDKTIGEHSLRIVSILEKVFRKNKQGKNKVYWWNEKVAQIHKQLKCARRRMRKYKYENLRQVFNPKRWEFRRIVNEVKMEAWKRFTSNIEDPWDKLVKIVKVTMTGRIQSRTLCNLYGEYASNMSDTLYTLGKQFYPTPDPLLDIHRMVERNIESLLCNVSKGPNITVCEFRKAEGEMSANTAPGFGKITNNVISILVRQKQLEREYIQLYNMCLRKFYFPTVWKTVKIVLIPKTSDNMDSTKAFKPISLTSSFAKLFERIMLARLMHYLTISNTMVSNQHAYNKGRSTQTALYELFDIAQYAMQRRGMCVVVFLDISGAFDRTWHHGILQKLLEYGVPKYLVLWIKSFLSGRTAIFKEGGEEHTVQLQQGCPQGGVLSPILWNILFNELLALSMDQGRKKSDCMKIVGYADDAALICKADSMEEIENMLNRHLEKIRKWSVCNKVKFNPQKLATLTLCNKQQSPPVANIYYDGSRINSVQIYRFFGLQVDSRLLWTLHIKGGVNKLALVTRSLWGLSREGWGISLDIYRTLFHSIFTPVLTYGIAIWGWKATSKVVSTKFDREIRNFALMATQCQKSTATTYLLYLLKAQPFSQILVNEVTKVSINQLHIINTKRQSVYETYEKCRRTRIIPQCVDQQYYMLRKGLGNTISQVEFDNVNDQFSVHPAQWVQTKVVIQDTVSAIVEGADMRGWVIFTDASASSYSFGWGYVAYKHGVSKMMCNGSLSECLIFMAEAYAVLQAVRYANTIEGLRKKEVVEIRSDAQGLLKTLEQVVHTNVLLCKIKQQLRIAYHAGRNIFLRWVPGHQGVYGNEFADLLAKRGVDAKSITFMPVTIRDIAQVLKKKKCDINAVNKLVTSAPTVAVYQLVSGHTRLNEFVYRILGLKASPECKCGKGKETVVHFMFYCELYDQLRTTIWEDFQPSFEYVTHDWEKLKEFVKRTQRFEGRIMKSSIDRGGKRVLAIN